MRQFLTLPLLLCAAASPAFANDTMSTLGAGGLVFVETEEVKMASEDLYVSPTEVRVKYEFRNETDHDVKTLVAFPLPDIKGDGDFMVSIPTEDPDNIFGFATSFEGEPVDAELHQYVFATNLDYTDYLKELGVPLEPFGRKTLDAIDALSEAQKVDLFKHGLVVPMVYSEPAAIRVMVPMGSEIDGQAKIGKGTRLAVVGGSMVAAEASARWPGARIMAMNSSNTALDALRKGEADAYVDTTDAINALIDPLKDEFQPLWDVYDEKTEYTPVWTLKSTYSWEAVFPAGETVEVEHSYKPSVGGTVGVTFLSPPYEDYDPATTYKTKYCMDDDFVNAVKKTLPNPDEPYGAPFFEQWLSYIWSTGNNWSGSIGKFHLTIDKGRPENLVSFCWNGEVEKTSPTTFEMEATDWWPPYGRELDILILNKQDTAG
jgi:hypothetical protein